MDKGDTGLGISLISSVSLCCLSFSQNRTSMAAFYTLLDGKFGQGLPKRFSPHCQAELSASFNFNFRCAIAEKESVFFNEILEEIGENLSVVGKK